MRIAVMTGASAGIGRELVKAVDSRYDFDEIWVIARRLERLQELASGSRNRMRPVVMDLSDPASFEEYRSMLESEQPEIGMLCNSAGCGVFGPFEEKDLNALLNSVQLNSVVLTAMCHISLPYMKKGGSIINVGSNSSWQPVPYINVYGSSKAYVLNFSRALGVELKDKGIHVMAVAPGWIQTEFFDHAVHDDTIKYMDKIYPAEAVIEKAMKDLAKNKTVSILGFPVRMQVRAIKFLPVSLVMKIWCRQQGK